MNDTSVSKKGDTVDKTDQRKAILLALRPDGKKGRFGTFTDE
jgi:hypothetical protein